jgi:hypothetical protein
LSTEQPNSPTFFFDRTHGNLIRDLLRSIGWQIIIHRTMGWADDKPDVEWIAECGKYNWPIISGDTSIEKVPEERQAVIDARCKVFMLDDSHITKTADWAAAVLVGRHRIAEIVNTTTGPLFVTVKPTRLHGHISQPRFITKAGAGWKTFQPVASAESPPAVPHKGKRGRAQQTIMEFPEHSALQMYRPLAAHCELCARLFGLLRQESI